MGSLMPLDELMRCSATDERLGRCQKWKGHSGPHIRTWTTPYDVLRVALESLAGDSWGPHDETPEMRQCAKAALESSPPEENAMVGEFWYDGD